MGEAYKFRILVDTTMYSKIEIALSLHDDEPRLPTRIFEASPLERNCRLKGFYHDGKFVFSSSFVSVNVNWHRVCRGRRTCSIHPMLRVVVHILAPKALQQGLP